ncbi:MAG: ribonuclease III domain-containing protein [Solirubrobacteraceae bacterium]
MPTDLRRQVFTHASWSPRRSDSYARLAFLGDAVLELAITAHLYPRLEAERYGEGRLSKIRAQTVCAAACEAVALRLGVQDELRKAAPPEAGPAEAVFTERVLSSITEAVIGACFQVHGYEIVARAVVEAFQPELEAALTHPVDHKSALQERLAQSQKLVEYELLGRRGPEHEPTFEVVSKIGGKVMAHGEGRTKKAAEQDAALATMAAIAAGKPIAAG